MGMQTRIIIPSGDYRSGVDALRQLLDRVRKNDTEFQQIARDRDSVLARYSSVFSAKGIKRLREDVFRSFLTFENNRHWNGLHRQGPKICSDMNRLRQALLALLDERT